MLRKYAKYTLIASFIASAAIAIYGLYVAKKAESIELILCFFLAASVILAIAFGIYLLFNRIEDNNELMKRIMDVLDESEQKKERERSLAQSMRIADEVDRQLAHSANQRR